MNSRRKSWRIPATKYALASGNLEMCRAGFLDAMNERDIFIAALQITDPRARDVFLTAACTEPGQKERLKALLAAEPGLGSFLEAPGRAADSMQLKVPGHAHPNREGQDARTLERERVPRLRPP